MLLSITKAVGSMGKMLRIAELRALVPPTAYFVIFK